ncbi:uncharacterized protein [Parasteatoda tepidariorum]|uniref:uncharacterized protein n=1 Tax=Parasteatoda tepidariorum TaxID=114398 RepID=UPI0039BCDFFD
MANHRSGRGGKTFRTQREPELDLADIRKKQRSYAYSLNYGTSFDESFEHTQRQAINIDAEIAKGYEQEYSTIHIERLYEKKFLAEEMLILNSIRDSPAIPTMVEAAAAKTDTAIETPEPEMTSVQTETVPEQPKQTPEISAENSTEPESEPPKKKKRKKTPTPEPTENLDISTTNNISEPVATSSDETTDQIQIEIPQKNCRKLKFLVKGLPIDSKIPILEEELIASGHRPIRIEQYKKRRGEGYKLLPLFLILLPDSPENRECINIKQLLSTTVQIERFRGGRFEVQKFGHTQKNCPNEPACMKCAGAHFTFQCTKPKSLPATCINCDGNHPACFSGCYARPRRKPQQKQRQPKSANETANKFLQIFRELQELLQNEELVQLLRSLLPENKT